ncbi:parallel beta-helix repeat protein [Motilibacter peucedani]|uniref:Parallel beta-helix repeat protein n=1 Tax=Motilibacter peucedani TaxID=598650 RepID=A0A420XLB7_9ACTN|nr:DUF1524 domain-containing protein [Motilibacter peucedani]RKS69228.1 parallel beta-helix repeat protein [Motilibacter peucedani]
MGGPTVHVNLSRLRERVALRPRAAVAAVPALLLAGLVGVPAVSSPAQAAAPTARTVLAKVKVKAYAPVTGYTAARFGKAWADINHDTCDTKNDILWRDLGRTAVLAPRSRCVVARGSFHSFYTGRTIRYSRTHPANTAVDRVVTTQQAWRTGARSWTAQKRLIFANDPLNLVTVDKATSARRGNRDASTWKPATTARSCSYVARRIAVQAKYGLWTTAAEKKTYTAVLAHCPRQPAPTGGAALPRAAGRPAPGGTTTPGDNLPAPGSTVNPSPRPTTGTGPGGTGTGPGSTPVPGSTAPGSKGSSPKPGFSVPPTQGSQPEPGRDHTTDWTVDQMSPTFDPGTTSELRKAAVGARPGTVMTLTPGLYLSRLVISASGTPDHPIVLQGPRDAVLSSGGIGSGTGLYITGSWVVVKGITLSHSQKGVLLDGSVGTVLDGIQVTDIGNEGVHFRKGTTRSVLRNSWIHDTGKSSPGFGEGVYVGSAVKNWKRSTGDDMTPDRSDGNLIEGNTIQDTTAEGVDVKEGTSGGVITGNTFLHSGYSGANSADSWIDLKGSGWSVTDNRGTSAGIADAVQVHHVLFPLSYPRDVQCTAIPGSGEDNAVSGTTFTDGGSASLFDEHYNACQNEI